RLRFADRLQKHLFHDGALAVEVAQARWMDRANQIERAIVGESARWGDFRDDIPDPSNSPAELYTLRDHWIPARDTVLVEYIPDCNELALERFRAAGLYPEVEPPILSRHGGVFEPGFRLGLTAPAGSVYYTLDGTDPRLEGGAVSPDALLAGGAASVELLASPSPATWFVPSGPDLGLSWTLPDFDDAAWGDGMSALGYERQSGYEDDFVTDVEGVMHGENGSIYMRVPFVVDDPGTISFLSLSMKYDDGYVAYLNGVEVGSRNAPGDPQWNSRATRSHPDSAAVVFETLDISSHRDALVAGVNVLAVHGLNASVTSSDFLIIPEIGGGSVSESGVELTETTRFLGRARLGVNWSALVETVFFATGPLPLRISEIMYHSPAPPEASDFSGEDFDYLELVNAGEETISLEGVRFTGGIRFDFSGHPMTRLEPGEVVLIVEDVEAFETRYDTRGMRILGEYEGKLDNGGEELWLEDALGEVISSFEYSDSWYPLTDGQGLSLEIVDAGAAPESWGRSASWRAGQQFGSPGVHDFTPQPGGLQRLGDFNQDGELDISDPIGLLRYLFIAGAPEPPCEGGDLDAGANLVLLDLNGDVSLDLSDAIYALSFLFAAGPPPVPGADCQRIEGCPDICTF
ncbi:MAG: lamin tail domain-containing protein, partial [Planctomycetota bacterium]|nr:lamin tail domain-containing protein [Planctomycetota bacterium]